jgi:Sulphur oxidation protein SoxZ.
MSSIKPRVKVPKEVSIDEIIEIKTLIRHPMHSGRMKENKGQIIPRQKINSFSAKFKGKEVFQKDLEPSISTNPFMVFQYKVKERGTFDFEWIDENGEKYYISKERTVS